MRPWTRALEGGHDPDPRFTFANERTFLAWIRTSLGLIAAGVGLGALGDELPGWGRHVLSVTLVALGGALAASAFRRWLRAEVALRHDMPLPTNAFAPVLAYVLAAGAGVALALVLLG